MLLQAVPKNKKVKQCKWRHSFKSFSRLASVRKKRTTYLKLWRKAKSDPSLKSAPSYLCMAKACGVNLAQIKDPRGGEQTTKTNICYKK